MVGKNNEAPVYQPLKAEGDEWRVVARVQANAGRSVQKEVVGLKLALQFSAVL